jgi:hypothetical protein
MSFKVKKTVIWIRVVLLTLQFVAAAAGKLTGAAEKRFVDWGYSSIFSYVIDVLELLGAIGLFFSKDKSDGCVRFNWNYVWRCLHAHRK